ncbi:MAG: type II secretion system F family protein [Candidatus Nanopelagicales bacterium]|nr:type II secretion system F family protein [Candidatus Nanopelagicales bacterium]
MAKLTISEARVKPVDLMHATRQLSAFIRAGIPVFEAVTELADEAASKPLRRVLKAMADDLRAGSTLTDSVLRHPKDFPNYYPGILNAAEITGRLDLVLDQLATYIERDIEARRKIKSVMTYPVIIAIMAVGTVVVLTAFVLPQFTSFFSDMKVELPAATRALMAATAFLQAWWWLIVIGFIVLVVAYKFGMRRTGFRRVRDRIVLRLPVIGPTVRSAAIERFTRIMASLVSAGISLPEAMAVSAASLRNLVFEDALAVARHDMIAGSGLAGPITATGLFPGMANQMIRVGEETGTLDTQLEVAADYYATELDYKINKLSTVFEPAMILIMGGIVGFVAIALVSAMYGVFQAGNLS